jgi:hypothetical protein
MNRQQRKDLLEAIGFAALIASLIFVGIETRNSTEQAALTAQALELSSYQQLMDNISRMNEATIENPEVAALMYKAYRTSDELTELEQFTFGRAMYLRFRHGDMAYFQYQRGAIDEVRLRSALQVLNLGAPRVTGWWNQNQGNFVDSYQDYINKMIDEIDARIAAD